ncbi:chorismate-binding protein [Propioniferax innocua]
MMPTIRPSLDEFVELAADRRVITVAARVMADADTPISLFRHLCGDRPGTFLLESVEAGVTARFSFIGVDTVATLTTRDGQAAWTGKHLAELPGAASGDSDLPRAESSDPLEVFARTLELLESDPSYLADADLPPLTSGFVGYLGYDIVRRLERLPDTCEDDLDVPEMAMMLIGDLVVMDHHTGAIWVLANAINHDNRPERVHGAYADAVARIEAMIDRLGEPREAAVTTTPAEVAEVEPVRQRTPEQFHAMVRDAVAQVHAGEAFQIVVSQRFDMPHVDGFALYRRLRRLNPSPYQFLLRCEGFDIVGSSPEALITVRDGHATTHPIAGSRPRGATAEQDRALEDELVADEKERSEHVMLVDLQRNDLARVCEPGSVRVLDMLHVVRYSHIMHLEATVVGKLAADAGALDATLACFPAGTLSGAPKVSAMAHIDRLEATRRGVYGGVVGWFNLAGDSDCAIAIRSALVKPDAVHIQAGAGIVADSDPEAEDLECRNKAAAVITAVNQARAWGA